MSTDHEALAAAHLVRPANTSAANAVGLTHAELRKRAAAVVACARTLREQIEHSKIASTS